nr:VAN3-binding protein [Tanacetum cinerariifolium]
MCVFVSIGSGHFTSSEDGTLTYKRGEANAANVTSETPFTDLKLRFVEICDLNRSLLIMKVLRYLRGDNTLQPLFAIAHGDYGAGRSNTLAVAKTVGRWLKERRKKKKKKEDTRVYNGQLHAALFVFGVAATVATLTATTAAA